MIAGTLIDDARRCGLVVEPETLTTDLTALAQELAYGSW
jgi:hypothetical protein